MSDIKRKPSADDKIIGALRTWSSSDDEHPCFCSVTMLRKQHVTQTILCQQGRIRDFPEWRGHQLVGHSIYRHNQCIFVLITLYVFLENFGCLLIQEKNVIFTFSERQSEFTIHFRRNYNYKKQGKLLNVICSSLLIQSLEMSGQTSSAW